MTDYLILRVWDEMNFDKFLAGACDGTEEGLKYYGGIRYYVSDLGIAEAENPLFCEVLQEERPSIGPSFLIRFTYKEVVYCAWLTCRDYLPAEARWGLHSIVRKLGG